jgi:peptide/nickel transport system substrate-binding protein
LRIGLGAEIITLGFKGSNDLESISGMYDPLLTYDANLQPVPSLIESWEQSADLKQVKLNIRKNVVFHSGRELTSDDVSYNLTRATDPTKTSPNSLVGLAKLWTHQVVDKYTVVLTSDQPRVGAFDFLTQIWVGDKSTIESSADRNQAIGTGPFAFDEWIQGDHVAFSKNKNYWRSGQPYLDGYTVFFERDPQAMITTFESGELDLVDFPQITDAVRLGKDTRYQVVPAYDVGLNYAIWMNVNVPPLDRQRVRQALSYAIDRRRFVGTTLAGLVPTARALPWPPSSPASEPSKDAQYAFDLDKASELLKSSGISDVTLDVNYSTTGPAVEFAQLAQIYQSDLAQIGVKLNIVPMDNATWSATAAKAGYAGLAIGTPGGFAGQDASSGLQTGAYGIANQFGNFKDATYTQLVQAAAAEVDAARRKQLYGQINDVLLDQSFTMNVSSLLTLAIATSKVHGLHRGPTGGGLILQDVWMD